MDRISERGGRHDFGPGVVRRARAAARDHGIQALDEELSEVRAHYPGQVVAGRDLDVY